MIATSFYIEHWDAELQTWEDREYWGSLENASYMAREYARNSQRVRVVKEEVIMTPRPEVPVQ